MTELLKKAKQGDAEARALFAEQNLGLVRFVAKRFSDRDAMEDLFQIGCIGLMKAVDRFELSSGVCFSTFAVPYIMGEIKMYLRDGGMIKISRGARALSEAVRREEERWRQAYKKEPHISDIAAVLHVSVQEAAAAVLSRQAVDSLDRPIGEDELLLGDLLSKEDETEEILGSMALKEALNALPERERQIIYLRYFEKKTQGEIAARLGMSQAQISRLEKVILKKLHTKLQE